jgi:hypothetical protein
VQRYNGSSNDEALEQHILRVSTVSLREAYLEAASEPLESFHTLPALGQNNVTESGFGAVARMEMSVAALGRSRGCW